MKVKIFMICLAILALSCESRQYFIADVENPVYKPNLVFQTMEDLTNPGFRHLIEKYQIECTPNTIKTEVSIEGSNASVRLISDTPNLKKYQVRESSEGDWSTVENNFKFELKNKKYEITFRAVNLAGVSGPEHRVIIDSE